MSHRNRAPNTYFCIQQYPQKHSLHRLHSPIRFERGFLQSRFKIYQPSQFFASICSAIMTRCCSAADISALQVIHATKEDMLLFPIFLTKIWSARARDEAVCVQPLDIWSPPSDELQDSLKIVTRQQALPHPLFTDRTVHSTVFRQQRRAQKAPNLCITSESGQLLDITFIESTRVMTVSQHQRTAEIIGTSCRKAASVDLKSITHSSQSGQSSHSGHSSQASTDEILFWRLMKQGLEGKPVHVWYAADVVWFDCNTKRLMKKRRVNGGNVLKGKNAPKHQLLRETADEIKGRLKRSRSEEYGSLLLND